MLFNFYLILIIFNKLEFEAVFIKLYLILGIAWELIQAANEGKNGVYILLYKYIIFQDKILNRKNSKKILLGLAK